MAITPAVDSISAELLQAVEQLSGVSLRKRYQEKIELLVKMVKDAIEVRRYKQPPAKDHDP